MSETEFAAQVADAYEHLYDLVYLRTHPVLDKLTPQGQPSKRRARRLHRLLLDVVAELDPGPQAPPFSTEWRRHRLMLLRYVKGLSPQAVADEMIVSLRHYYRLHKAAVEDVASILWDRHAAQPPTLEAVLRGPVGEEATVSRLELLRLEAARMAQADRYARVEDVVEGAFALLHEMLRQRRLDVRLALPETLPGVAIDQSLLRQTLLGPLGYLVERAGRAAVRVTGQAEGSAVCLSLAVEPQEAVLAAEPAEADERLAAFEEMAALTAAQILPMYAGRRIVGFDVRLPIAERTVLVVDDNEDILELCRSYLSPHRYRVVTAQTAPDALEKARQIRPYAITLDLMMPQQDGWDALQGLLNQPDTRLIPVIVCSVLKQKELALSLGATAFLEKPITEQALLSALEALDRT